MISLFCRLFHLHRIITMCLVFLYNIVIFTE